MKKLLTISSMLALVSYSFAEVDYWGTLQKQVDYWGILQKQSPPSDNKPVEVPKNTDNKPIKIEPPKESSKAEPDPDKVLKESIKWYEEKLKKEKPPIEYWYFIDTDKYAKAYLEWLKWQQEKGNQLVNPVMANASNESLMTGDIEKIVKDLKKRGYYVLYFYRPDCPYCQAFKPEIEKIEKNFKVFAINVYQRPDLVSFWGVTGTPTTIFISQKEKKTARFVGYGNYVQVLVSIYSQVGSNNEVK